MIGPENHATVKPDSSVTPRGMKTCSESRIEPSIILSMFQSKQGLQKRSSRLRRIHSGTRSWCSITMITVTDLFSLLLLYIYKISKKPFKIQGLGSGQAVMVKTEQNTVVLQVRCNSTQKIEERNYELKSKIKTSH